jgi:queuine/archaeosine tRNA-ribosyltransferase
MDRARNIHFGGTCFALPTFFPSVSSVKTNLSPLEYIEVLNAVGVRKFLVSAYDMANGKEIETLRALIDDTLSRQTVVLLDSGNYESYWMRDAKWNTTRFHSVLKASPWPIAFSFDVFPQPEISNGEYARTVAESCIQDQSCRDGCAVVPIVHGSSESLPEACVALAAILNPLLLAVPERELGDGIFARLATVAKIRRRLNELGAYYPLHLLGTGNPQSIVVYAAAGADSFDGLEWCQTVANPKTGQLLHFHQRDLLDEQLFATSSDAYVETTLMHNLLLYESWMRGLQEAVSSESLIEYMRKNFSFRVASHIEAVIRAH